MSHLLHTARRAGASGCWPFADAVSFLRLVKGLSPALAPHSKVAVADLPVGFANTFGLSKPLTPPQLDVAHAKIALGEQAIVRRAQ